MDTLTNALAFLLYPCLPHLHVKMWERSLLYVPMPSLSTNQLRQTANFSNRYNRWPCLLLKNRLYNLLKIPVWKHNILSGLRLHLNSYNTSHKPWVIQPQSDMVSPLCTVCSRDNPSVTDECSAAVRSVRVLLLLKQGSLPRVLIHSNLGTSHNASTGVADDNRLYLTANWKAKPYNNFGLIWLVSSKHANRIYKINTDQSLVEGFCIIFNGILYLCIILHCVYRLGL